MIFKLEIALIFYWLHNNGALHVPHCVLKCKDAHMQQMEKEWSANFAFPLLSLLKATGNETAAHNRAIEIFVLLILGKLLTVAIIFFSKAEYM
ncbi:unnamed protein product [Thelazia callipaeda]|uniref:Secreted protein n=1 Tax=Thelazia callipaeda TaxID=103827 RepID=A0A0N5D524_THECL|nr:unnamed protein product [Thelazia callipaeda]